MFSSFDEEAWTEQRRLDAAHAEKQPYLLALSQLRNEWISGRTTLAKLDEKFWALIVSMSDLNTYFTKGFDERCQKFFYFTKALCFSANKMNNAMWAHYADSHRGAILVFTPNDRSAYLRQARPVYYTDDPRYIFDKKLLPRYVTGQISWNDPEFLRWMKQIIYFTKTTAWKGEEEWRIIMDYPKSDHDDFEDRTFDSDELKSIILGYNADAAFEQECREIVASAKYGRVSWKRAVRGLHALEYIDA